MSNDCTASNVNTILSHGCTVSGRSRGFHTAIMSIFETDESPSLNSSATDRSVPTRATTSAGRLPLTIQCRICDALGAPDLCNAIDQGLFGTPVTPVCSTSRLISEGFELDWRATSWAKELAKAVTVELHEPRTRKRKSPPSCICCRSYSPDGQDIVALTSGEAKNPGPPGSSNAAQPAKRQNPPVLQKKPPPPKAAQALRKPVAQQVARAPPQAQRRLQPAVSMPHRGYRNVGGHMIGSMSQSVSSDNITHIHSTELLGSASQDANVDIAIGDSMLPNWPKGVPIHPDYFGPRVRNIARNFGKFRLRKLVAHYISTISVANPAASGSFIMVWGPDPDVTFPTGQAGLEALSNWAPNSRIVAVTETADLVPSLAAGGSQQTFLFMRPSEEDRFGQQGRLGLQAASNFSADTTSREFGQFVIECDWEFAEANVPTDQPPTVMFTATNGAVVTSGASGDSAFDGGVWFGSTDEILKVPTAEYGGNLLLLPAPGFEDYSVDLDEPYPVWLLELHWRGNTPGAGTTVLPNIAYVSGGGRLNELTAGLRTNDLVGNSINAQLVNTGASTWNGANDVTRPNGVLRACFYATEATVIDLQMPTMSAGDAEVSFSFTRFMIDDSSPRQTPSALMTTRQSRALMSLERSPKAAEQQLKVLVSEDVKRVNTGERLVNTKELEGLASLAMILGLPTPKVHPTMTPVSSSTTANFLPLLASAAASAAGWLLKEYGPKIAAHVLHWGKKKIEKFEHRHRAPAETGG